MHELPCSPCVACIPPSIAWQQHAHQSPAVHLAQALRALPPRPASAACPAAAPRAPKPLTSLYHNASQLRLCALKLCTADGPATEKIDIPGAAQARSQPPPRPPSKPLKGRQAQPRQPRQRPAPSQTGCASRGALSACIPTCRQGTRSGRPRPWLAPLELRLQLCRLASLMESSCRTSRPCWPTRG